MLQSRYDSIDTSFCEFKNDINVTCEIKLYKYFSIVMMQINNVTLVIAGDELSCYSGYRLSNWPKSLK